MPSEKVLGQKQELVEKLKEKLNAAVAGVVVDYKGISVSDDTALRKALREAGVEYVVVKNTLLRFAAKDAGLEKMNDILEGTTALATSTEDPIIAAKILGEFADKHKNFKIKGGFMDGDVLDAQKVIAVGKLPSKQQLVGQLVSVLVAPIRGIAVALNAIAEQKESV